MPPDLRSHDAVDSIGSHYQVSRVFLVGCFDNCMRLPTLNSQDPLACVDSVFVTKRAIENLEEFLAFEE